MTAETRCNSVNDDDEDGARCEKWLGHDSEDGTEYLGRGLAPWVHVSMTVGRVWTSPVAK